MSNNLELFRTRDEEEFLYVTSCVREHFGSVPMIHSKVTNYSDKVEDGKIKK